MGSLTVIRSSHRQPARRRWSIKRLAHGVRAAWRRFLVNLALHFPPDEPQPTPPLAKAAALRDGALLSEYVDARSKKNVA
jgi:hypothetical protein